MNRYRVDRNDSQTRVPVGMNSILYIGDDLEMARKVYQSATPGYNHWNQPNDSYGVSFSEWDSREGDYIVHNWKGKE